MPQLVSSSVLTAAGTGYAGRNEDAGRVDVSADGTFIVACLADAHGGTYNNKLGEECAKVACNTVSRYLLQRTSNVQTQSTEMHGAFLAAATAAKTYYSSPVGSTLAVATGIYLRRLNTHSVVRLSVGVVGDSRIVHVRNGQVVGSTDIHTLGNAREYRRVLQDANVGIVDDRLHTGVVSLQPTRALGHKHVLSVPETYQWTMLPKDYIVMYTDGIGDVLKPSQIAAECGELASATSVAKRVLHTTGIKNGSFCDNASIVVWHFKP